MGTGDTKKKRKKEKREKSQAPLSALVGGQVTRSKSTMRIAFRIGGERKKSHKMHFCRRAQRHPCVLFQFFSGRFPYSQKENAEKSSLLRNICNRMCKNSDQIKLSSPQMMIGHRPLFHLFLLFSVFQHV